jgi:hypothetical protein
MPGNATAAAAAAPVAAAPKKKPLRDGFGWLSGINILQGSVAKKVTIETARYCTSGSNCQQ